MKRSKECRHLLESLSDFVNGDLNETLCTEIERHLAECEDCQIVVDTLRKTIYLYHTTSAEVPAVPTAVRERLFHKLNLDDFIQMRSD